MAQQCFSALHFAAHPFFGFVQGFFTVLGHLIFRNRIGVFVLVDLLIDDFFLLLNVPEIAHVAAGEKFLLTYVREQPFAKKQRRQPGVGLVQQSLFAQEVVLGAVVNGVQKVRVEQSARQHFRILVIDDVVFE